MTTRWIRGLCAIAAGLAGLSQVLAQTTEPNLSGVWRRNPEKSRASANPPAEMRVRIVQNGSDIAITFRVRNNGAEETNVERLRIGSGENKNEIHGAPMMSKASWEGQILVVESTAKFGAELLRMSARWTLSSDGQTLGLVERHQFGAEPQPTEDSYVFDRQPEESWQVSQTSQPAEQAYPNIKALKGQPADRIPSIMAGFARALNVQCAHCHVEGAMDREDKPTFGKARQMIGMRNWIAQQAKLEVACWTCHRSHATPQAGPEINQLGWPPELELTAGQRREPASKVYKNLKFFNSSASDLKTSMLFISAALGVGCSDCHVVGEWEKDDVPAKNTARSMLTMVRDLRGEFPDARVGCFTCHRGARKPENDFPAASR